MRESYINKKLPNLCFEDQYTVLQRQKKPNALLSLSEELKQMQRLPIIQKKGCRTGRKHNKQILELEEILYAHKKRTNHLSQHRYQKSNLMPLYIPMPVSVPIRIQYIAPPPQLNIQSKAEVKPISNKLLGNDCEKQAQQVSKAQQIQKKTKEINKFPEKSRLNRFRIVAYAVYFSIYFKYFSRKFTELRRNWFHERYALDDGKIILESSVKILKNLHEVDIYKMVKVAKQKVKDIEIEGSSNKSESAQGSDSVLILIHFVSLLIDYAREYMTDQRFIKEHHEVFTVGVLNQNFMLNNLYLPQEAAILHIHPHGYILVGEQTQIILLMLKIIIKILVYNFLLGLKLSRQWNSKQQKSYGLDDSDMEELWMITRNSGIFLCVVCEQIYEKAYKEIQSPLHSYNFKEVSARFNVLPAKSLEQVKTSKTNLHPNDSNSKLILNLEGYNNMRILIDQSPPLKKFKENIKLQIIDFLTVIYTYLKYEEAQVYDFCKFLTLDEKYLILKGLKQDLTIQNKKKRKKDRAKDKENQDRYDENGNKIRKKRTERPSANDQADESVGEAKKEKDNISQKKQIETYSDSSGSGNQQQEYAKRPGKKKLRFKHEQAFFDHKFDGGYKMQKLKKKMAR